MRLKCPKTTSGKGNLKSHIRGHGDRNLGRAGLASTVAGTRANAVDNPEDNGPKDRTENPRDFEHEDKERDEVEHVIRLFEELQEMQPQASRRCRIRG